VSAPHTPYADSSITGHVEGMAQRLDHHRFAFGLTDASVEELRSILREECGEELSFEQAWARAIQLVALFRALVGIAPTKGADAEFELPPS